MPDKNNPLVSIILCFYNEERFLQEAVASVFAQDYTHWELFLVDDGSSDKSVEIAKNLSLQYAGKIFYLEHESHANKGLSASRNHGIKKAKGDFVAFIDADDVWLPGKLSQQLSIFYNNPEVTFVIEGSLYWYSWNDPNNDDVLIPVGATQNAVFYPPQLMLQLYPLGKGAAPCPSGFMMRKAVLDKNLFEESFRGIYQMYEDQAFLCKMYLHEVIFVSSACNNKYRQRPASLVSSVHDSGRYNVVRQYYLEWFKKYLTTNRIERSDVNQKLRRALMPYHQPMRFRMQIYYPQRIKAKIAGILVKLGILNYSKR